MIATNDVKMLTLMEYKNVQGTVEISLENNVLYGHLVCPNLIAGYDGETVEEFIAAFKDAVDYAIESGHFSKE